MISLKKLAFAIRYHAEIFGITADELSAQQEITEIIMRDLLTNIEFFIFCVHSHTVKGSKAGYQAQVLQQFG